MTHTQTQSLRTHLDVITHTFLSQVTELGHAKGRRAVELVLGVASLDRLEEDRLSGVPKETCDSNNQSE